jgi:hypothetical protein
MAWLSIPLPSLMPLLSFPTFPNSHIPSYFFISFHFKLRLHNSYHISWENWKTWSDIFFLLENRTAVKVKKTEYFFRH